MQADHWHVIPKRWHSSFPNDPWDRQYKPQKFPVEHQGWRWGWKKIFLIMQKEIKVNLHNCYLGKEVNTRDGKWTHSRCVACRQHIIQTWCLARSFRICVYSATGNKTLHELNLCVIQQTAYFQICLPLSCFDANQFCIQSVKLPLRNEYPGLPCLFVHLIQLICPPNSAW